MEEEQFQGCRHNLPSGVTTGPADGPNGTPRTGTEPYPGIQLVHFPKLREKSEHFPGMKVSVAGVASRIKGSRGTVGRGDRFMVGEIARLYYEGREAWLRGDLETVAEMFGILV
jgi:hypothetical protein